MGEVYLAEDTKLGRNVALKVMLPEMTKDGGRIDRFVREARAASALNHPNILTVFEIGEFGDSQYLSTEFISGETLGERMRRGPVPVDESLRILLQITAALSAAHSVGIIHRDIKPENIMIREDGVVKVLDFGLAKLSPLSAASIQTTLRHITTEPGVIVGTIAYMSPEQARGRAVDQRSDIFSLGIVMFELFAGARPFRGENQLDVVSSILKDEPPVLREISPDLPRDLERIVTKALRKDLEHRYQNVKDLHIDLEDLAEEVKSGSKRPRKKEHTVERPVQRTEPSALRSAFTTGLSKTRRFTLLHAIIFAALASAVIGGVIYFRPSPDPDTVSANVKVNEFASWNSAPNELFVEASFSPNANLIAFSSTRSGNKAIWVSQTNSSEAIKVTNDGGENRNPIWSPKGEEIAFLSLRTSPDGKNEHGLWRVSALGGQSRSIARVQMGGVFLRRWTASGKIFYQAGSELHYIDSATGRSEKVVDLTDVKPIWIDTSPDEKTIAYAVREDGSWRILTSENGGSPVEAASGKGQIASTIAWLPDRKTFFFSSEAAGSWATYRTVARSFVNQRVVAPESRSYVSDAAADGSSLILTSAKEESNLWRVDVASGSEDLIIRDLNAKIWPSISPSGSEIVFQSIKNLVEGDRLMKADLATLPVVRSSMQEVPTVISKDGYLPTWSPDGRSIAFLRGSALRSELVVLNSSGGGERPAIPLGTSALGFSFTPYNATQTGAYDWSPDGSRIAMIIEKDKVANVWSYSLGDGSLTQITSNATNEQFQCPTWSSDGKFIAFSYRVRDAEGNFFVGFRVVDVATGSVEEVYKGYRAIRLIGWDTSDTGLVAVETSREHIALPPETRLFRIGRKDKSETTIANLKSAYFFNIFLSKDRRQVAFAARENELDDIWLVPVSGGTPRRLTSTKDSGLLISRMAWFPNGDSIAFGKQTRFSVLSLATNFDP